MGIERIDYESDEDYNRALADYQADEQEQHEHEMAEEQKEHEMKRYIGTKFLKGKPMTLGEYNEYRGWTMPVNENPDDPGYLVEYEDGGESNHPDHEGYISWSPHDVFINTYRELYGLVLKDYLAEVIAKLINKELNELLSNLKGK